MRADTALLIRCKCIKETWSQSPNGLVASGAPSSTKNQQKGLSPVLKMTLVAGFLVILLLQESLMPACAEKDG